MPDASSDADHCVAHLINALRSGELKPGQRLGEESIAKALCMGRAPVRIAFERMVSAGLFERVHRSGTFVRRLSLAEYGDLVEIRALLEGHAARQAALRAEAALLEEISRAADELENLIEQAPAPGGDAWNEVRRLEIEFHLLVARAAANETLERLLNSQHLVRLCFVGRGGALPFHASTAAADPATSHRAVAGAIASRQPDRAEALMRRHVLVPFQALLAQAVPRL